MGTAAGRWRAETVRGITLLRCGTLEAAAGVAHAFSTRSAEGEGDFDLGGAERDDPAWTDRRLRFRDAAGLSGPPAILLQVHGTRIVRAAELPAAGPVRADGVLALAGDRRGVAPAVRVADCVPLLLADRQGRAVAAVHAGWRGTARGVARTAVERLGALGIPAGGLLAALGPAIGPCCYEVSDEVAGEVAAGCGCPPGVLARRGPNGRPLLDLREANRLQLLAAGLPGEAIDAAPWCTACTPEWFFSYRRDGTESGRLMACVGWAPGAP